MLFPGLESSTYQSFNYDVSYFCLRILPGGGLTDHPLFQDTTLKGRTVFAGVNEGAQGKYKSDFEVRMNMDLFQKFCDAMDTSDTGLMLLSRALH